MTNEPGGPQTQAEPLAGFYCFGDPEYQNQAIDLMVDHGITWNLVSYNGWGDIGLDGTIKAQDFRAAETGIIDLMERAQGKLKVALLVGTWRTRYYQADGPADRRGPRSHMGHDI